MLDLIAVTDCGGMGWRMGVVREKAGKMTEFAVKIHTAKPIELVKVEDAIVEKRAQQIRMLSLTPVPECEIDELDDEIERLEKQRRTLIAEWQS